MMQQYWPFISIIMTTCGIATASLLYPASEPEESRAYLTSSLNDGCGGLGNVLYRFATVNAIAHGLNRTLFYEHRQECMHAYKREMETIFPEMARQILFIDVPQGQLKTVRFGDHCCSFDCPLRLRGESQRFVCLSGLAIQSPKFFTSVQERKRVKEAFTCGIKPAKILADADQHLLCVHSRRGDFVTHRVESQPDYTVDKGIPAAVRYLKKRNGHVNITVALIGDDRHYLQSLKSRISDNSHASLPAVLLPPGLNRGEEMCSAIHYCNSFIITAPASTFGWWIGYLMAEEWRAKGKLKPLLDDGNIDGLVFYNSDMSRTFPNSYSHASYPHEWIPV